MAINTFKQNIPQWYRFTHTFFFVMFCMSLKTRSELRYDTIILCMLMRSAIIKFAKRKSDLNPFYSTNNI